VECPTTCLLLYDCPGLQVAFAAYKTMTTKRVLLDVRNAILAVRSNTLSNNNNKIIIVINTFV